MKPKVVYKQKIYNFLMYDGSEAMDKRFKLNDYDPKKEPYEEWEGNSEAFQDINAYLAGPPPKGPDHIKVGDWIVFGKEFERGKEKDVNFFIIDSPSHEEFKVLEDLS